VNRESQLLDFLKMKFPEASGLQLTAMSRMPEGWSRESYTFDLEWSNDDDQKEQHALVLRIDPSGSLIYSDRNIEFHVIEAVHKAGFPVPQMWFLETGANPLGAPFLIMERVTGTASPEILYAENFEKERNTLGERFIELLSELHNMDIDSLDLPFVDRPTNDNAAELSLDHWEKTMREQQLEPQPFLTEGFRWLRANAPKAPRVSLLHGDYRAGNFLFEEDRITAIVDWELASLGDPLQDLGWAVMNLWRLNNKICGFYELEEFLQRYEEVSGIPVDRQAMVWWEVWANMKLAVIGLTGTRTRVLNLADEINYSISHLYLPPLFAEMAKGMGI
jgi:aminoglycoside phosphotransferase (APT) family kinase protein